jgi:hypothetical protein
VKELIRENGGIVGIITCVVVLAGLVYQLGIRNSKLVMK